MTATVAARPTRTRKPARTPKPGRRSARLLAPGLVRITVGARSTDYRVGPLPTGGQRRQFWLENVNTLYVCCVYLADDGDECDWRFGRGRRCRHVAAVRSLLSRGELPDPVIGRRARDRRHVLCID
jgi:hypothetical protein